MCNKKIPNNNYPTSPTKEVKYHHPCEIPVITL